MSKSNLQLQYNNLCAKLGELEFRLAVMNQEKSSLIKQASDLQKAWSTIESLTPTEPPATNESPDVAK